MFTSTAPGFGKSGTVREPAQKTGETAPDSIDDADGKARQYQRPENLVDPVTQHDTFQAIYHVGNDGKDHRRHQSKQNGYHVSLPLDYSY